MMYDKRTKEDLTPSSIRQILAPLREMLNHAVEDGILASNPATRNRPIPPAASEPKKINHCTVKSLLSFWRQ